MITRKQTAQYSPKETVLPLNSIQSFQPFNPIQSQFQTYSFSQSAHHHNFPQPHQSSTLNHSALNQHQNQYNQQNQQQQTFMNAFDLYT